MHVSVHVWARMSVCVHVCLCGWVHACVSVVCMCVYLYV